MSIIRPITGVVISMCDTVFAGIRPYFLSLRAVFLETSKHAFSGQAKRATPIARQAIWKAPIPLRSQKYKNMKILKA
jgi:hypothetical protein